MRSTTKALLWAGLFIALAALFYFLSPGDEPAGDSQIELTVLTREGPVVMTMAEYLPGVIAAEMPVSFGDEALKAQAVAARTFVLAGRRHGSADVCTDSGCCLGYISPETLQESLGQAFQATWDTYAAAVCATDGEYLTYDGQAIQAVFHASSAGATEDSGAIWSPLPYLVSVSSPESSRDVPNMTSTVTVSAQTFAGILGISPEGEPSAWVQAVETDAAGRVASVTVAGQVFSGTEMRSLFELRSTDFALAYTADGFQFTVAGYGHGVGMSQYGARAYAALGRTYREILEHYYPGTELTVYMA